MPPRDQQPSGSGHDDDENPFVAFRRFADEQFSSMLQGFVGLPSAFEAPKRGQWTTYDDWMRRSFGDWSGSFGAVPPPDSFESDSTEQRRDSEGTCSFLGKRGDECHNRQPHGTFGSAQTWNGTTRHVLPEIFFGPSWHVWLRQYLYGSKYSPSRLEDDARLGPYKNWVAAFEDLLVASAGLEMPKRNPAVLTANSADRGSWPAGQKVGKYAAPPPQPSQLPPPPAAAQAPVAPGGPLIATAAPDNCAEEHQDDEPRTELEMYERFLGGNAVSGEKDAVAASSFSSSVATQTPASEGLGIISTLTTTEKVTLPDGTTTTKVVLRKRFADGREETNETTHVTRGRDAAEQNGAPKHIIGAKDANDGGKDGQKKGWFWS